MNPQMLGCATCRKWFPEAELKRWRGATYCVGCFPRAVS
jgi:hypothetical protein